MLSAPPFMKFLGSSSKISKLLSLPSSDHSLDGSLYLLLPSPQSDSESPCKASCLHLSLMVNFRASFGCGQVKSYIFINPTLLRSFRNRNYIFALSYLTHSSTVMTHKKALTWSCGIVITILLTISLMPYLYLHDYFITTNLYLLIPSPF